VCAALAVSYARASTQGAVAIQASTGADDQRVRQVYLYFAPLTLLVYMALPDGYLLDLGTSFLLKDQLHATPSQVSLFRLVTAIPVYLAVLFGIARDSWNPFGLRDRGLFLIFAPLCTLVLLWTAFSPLSFVTLTAGMLLVAVGFRFISAAYQGLLALVSQEQGMAGRLSSLYNFGSYLCYATGAVASGYLAEHLAPRVLFLIAAALTALLTVLGVWQPQAIYAHLYDQPIAQRGRGLGDLRTLFASRATYPAVLLVSVANFGTASSTPLQFYLADELHAPDSVYANFTALNIAAYLPVFVLYAMLCKRVRLSRLLWWGTLLTLPSTVPLAFLHTPHQLLLAAIPLAMLSGIAQGAYIDLALRSCPPGLQGTLMTLVIGVWTLSFRGGDVVGAWLYTSYPGHGLSYCVAATTVVGLLLVPLVLMIPRHLTDTSDGDTAAAA